MDYGRLFSRAWNICWNNKYLFILGFLAALGSGTANSGPQFNYSFSGEELPPGFAQNFERFMQAAIPIFLTLACIGLIVGLILWLIRLTAQAGMIGAASRLDAGEKVSFGAAFSQGTRYLLRFVGLNLLLYGPLWFLGLVALGGILGASGAAIAAAVTGTPGQGPEALAGGAGILALCFVGLLCLLVPLGLVLTFIYPFAQRGVVLQDLGVVAGVRHGWRVLTQNLGDIILLAIIFIVIGIVFGIVAGIILLPLGFLAAGPALFGLFTQQSIEIVDVLFIILGLLVVGFIGALVNSIVVAFRSVTFTLAYEEFVEKTGTIV